MGVFLEEEDSELEVKDKAPLGKERWLEETLARRGSPSWGRGRDN